MRGSVFGIAILVVGVGTSLGVWARGTSPFVVPGSVDVTVYDGVTLRDGFPDDLLSGGLNASGLQGPAPTR